MSWWDDRARANALQWDGREHCYTEGYDLNVLDPDHQRGWWFRYGLTAPIGEEPQAVLWGAHFEAGRPPRRLALRTTFPIRSFATQSDGFHIRVSKAELTDGSAKGGLRNPGDPKASLRWNLSLSRPRDPLRTYPKPRWYRGSWPPLRMLAPTPTARARGVVEVGDQRHQVQTAVASQTHHWGTRNDDQWTYGLATGFREDPDAVILGLEALPRLGGRSFQTFHFIDGDGDHQRFRDVRSKRASQPLDQRPGVWTLEAQNRRYTLSGRISASLQKIVGLTVPDPEGTQRFVHHTVLADATFELWRKGLTKPTLEQTLTAKGSAVLQQGAQHPFEDIEFFV